MNISQLDSQIAQNVIDDNPRLRFLVKLLPLYEQYRKAKAFTTKPTEEILGWVIRRRGEQYLIDREYFTVDSDGFRIAKPDRAANWYLGLRGCSPDQIVNFNFMVQNSPYSHKLYPLGTTVPKSKQDYFEEKQEE